MFLNEDAKGPIGRGSFQHTHSTCISQESVQGDVAKLHEAEARDCRDVGHGRFR